MNKNLEIWEDIFQNNEWGKYPSLAVVRFVARNFYKVPNRKDIRILELGCGTGANLWYCARERFSVIGLDGSKTAIHRMIDRFEKENLSEFLMDTKVGNYYNICFISGICYYSKGWEKFEVCAPKDYVNEMFTQILNSVKLKIKENINN